MTNWEVSLAKLSHLNFSPEKHEFVALQDFMHRPETAIESAFLQKFARITPQYPGVRAPLPTEPTQLWLRELSPLLDQNFGQTTSGWDMQAWLSIVTTSPADLVPMQRLPHVDGTDPNLIAMMLYLHETEHGGTAFFRHKSTGFESLTDDTFPIYKSALEADVRASGMPAARYVTNGSPLFERIHASQGCFNEAVFYRGNVLHSGIIENDAPLPLDPRSGRLTINALFRPK
ncbi:MAG: DUF6445 family protein [Pseudomonadota bacterium]